MTEGVERLGYRPGLDALRAAAVVIVLLGHLWGRQFPGVGTHGVTLFFTLSGFLITKLLVEERNASGRVAWVAFYQRRALRLLPALPLVIGVCALANHLNGFPVLDPVLTSSLYVHNLAVAWESQPGAFNHFWSLALEEQFYMLWPLTFWVVPTHRLERACFWSIPVLLVARIVLAGTYVGDGLEQSGITRVDSLLIGAWLAIVLQRRQLVVRGWIVLVAALTFAFWTLTGDKGASAVEVAPAAIGAATCVLIIWAMGFEQVPAPIVWIGRRSYGIYLWQAPMIWLLFDVHGSLVVGAATFVLAAASYRWIEEPFLRRKRRPSELSPEPDTKDEMMPSGGLRSAER